MIMRGFATVVALALAFATAALAADVPDATAEYESMRDGAPPTHGKMYVANGRFRSETETATTKVALIADPVAKKISILMPPPIGCVTQPLTDAVAVNTPLLASKDAKEELVGSETVGGHPAKKYKLTTMIAGTPHVQYLWRATDLKGFPLQTADENGKVKSTFKNIKLGTPDAKLFVAPADCKPIPAPRSPIPPAPR